MNAPKATNPRQLWERYRSNLPRHLLGISRYLQADTMHRLTSQRGHQGLRMSFEPYITLVGTTGCRLTEPPHLPAAPPPPPGGAPTRATHMARRMDWYYHRKG